jgi:hypothetical protein
MPPPQPSWPEPNVYAEATQIAADRQKMSAAISSKDFRVNTWEDFEAEFRKIEETNRSNSAGVWYRGQSNSCWQLDTTLERRAGGPVAAEAYFQMMRRVKPEIETYTERSWKMPDLPELEGLARNYDKFSQLLLFGQLPYDYMAYLRHHGFPSPLLDWTGSPYIAAYFAFANAHTSDSVAVYAFVERTSPMKIGGSDRPNISVVGPYIRTHKRHYLQRSRYTICTQHDLSSGWQFVPHQKVFDLGEAQRDVLWKIVIPASERTKVLSLLDRFNLNAYSLFGSEESLMETLAMREVDLKPKPSTIEITDKPVAAGTEIVVARTTP